MGKREKLAEIMRRLKDGEYLECNGCFMHFAWDGYAQHHTIRYTHYGGSAIRATIENLKWLLDVIAESVDYVVRTPEEYKAQTGSDFFYWGI